MANEDVKALLLQVDASVELMRRNLADGVRGLDDFDRRVSQTQTQTEGHFKKIGESANLARAAILAVVGSRVVGQITQAADAWSDMSSQIGRAGGDMERAPELMRRIADMARHSYSSLDLTAESVTANATAIRELGGSTEDLLRYTEALNNALVVSSTRGDRAAAVQKALSDAMATGKLQGDGLSTVLKNSDTVAQALANQLGTTVGGLQQFAREGKITGRVVAESLISNLEKFRAEAAEMPATMSDASVIWKNTLTEVIGRVDKATESSEKLAGAVIKVADAFRGLAGRAEARRDINNAMAALAAYREDTEHLWGLIRVRGKEQNSGAYVSTLLEQSIADLRRGRGIYGLAGASAGIPEPDAIQDASNKAKAAADSAAKEMERIRIQALRDTMDFQQRMRDMLGDGYGSMLALRQTSIGGELQSEFATVFDFMQSEIARMNEAMDEPFRGMAEFGKDISDNLAQAIVYGQSLGDALVNSFKAAAAEALSSGLFKMLLGGGTAANSGLLGGLVGGLFGGFRADGGPVSAGKAYVVGERGPELFMPPTAGRIVANDNLGSGVTINVDARGADNPAAVEQAALSAFMAARQYTDNAFASRGRVRLGRSMGA